MFALWLSIVLIVISLIVYYYKNVYTINSYLKRYRSPPGGYFLLGHTLQFLDPKGVLPVLVDWIPKYGETVRVNVGPATYLFTVEYKLLEWILSQNTHLAKAPGYDFLNRWLGTGLLTNNGGPKWRKHRKILTPAFHFKILEEYTDVFQTVGKKLVKRLEKEIGKKSINICPFITRYTLDVICETAMGTSVNALEDENSPYVHSVKEMLRIILERSFSAPKNFEFLYYFTKDYWKELRALKVLHDYTNAVIKSKLEKLESSFNNKTEKDGDDVGIKKKRSFLDILLSEMKTSSLSLQDIREEVATFMFAGHDTTASGLSFLIYNLSTHPEIQEKVYREQKEIFKNDSDRPVTGNDLREMKYLELVIKESIRLHPPVPFFARAISEDVIFDGQIFPKGIFIIAFVFGVHRNPKYFPDPDKFIPERFENIDGSNPFAYIPFSSGPRNCIGQKFAMSELKTITSELIRNFNFLPGDPQQPVELRAEVVLIAKNGVNVQLQKR